ncbi:hypothetical protein N309_14414, partial [Tinamus guttatus]
DCDYQVAFWNTAKILAVSLFSPGVASGKALETLNKLGCWLAKQTNATFLTLSGLLLDVNSVRHASLQNRATIDFLLLAQGHGCQDCDGLCCINLSDHSESIHKSIENLQGVQKLRQDNIFNIFGNLLGNLGLAVWIKGILQISLMCLIIFFCLLI